MNVADFGSGSGFYAMEAAKAVGESGVVYMVDIQKDLLAKTKNEANQNGLYNVEVIWGDVEKPGGTKLRDETLDAVIVSNLLFQVAHKREVLTEAVRVLKPKGRLLLVDWTDSYGGLGPEPGAVLNKDVATDLLQVSGFAPSSEINAGAHHYGIIAIKK